MKHAFWLFEVLVEAITLFMRYVRNQKGQDYGEEEKKN